MVLDKYSGHSIASKRPFRTRGLRRRTCKSRQIRSRIPRRHPTVRGCCFSVNLPFKIHRRFRGALRSGNGRIPRLQARAVTRRSSPARWAWCSLLPSTSGCDWMLSSAVGIVVLTISLVFCNIDTHEVCRCARSRPSTRNLFASWLHLWRSCASSADSR